MIEPDSFQRSNNCLVSGIEYFMRQYMIKTYGEKLADHLLTPFASFGRFA
jgi:hypothetical protein